MSLQDYYNEFKMGYWAEEDPQHCLCHGNGWALSDVDTWHECPIHYKGQLNPENYDGTETAEELQQREEESQKRYAEEVERRRLEREQRAETNRKAREERQNRKRIEKCPECQDGENFSPLDCSLCGDKLRRELAAQDTNVPDSQKVQPPPEDEDLGDIPF